MPGIDESCSSHISRLSQWHPLFPAAQGDILAAFLDALSSVHVLSPHAHLLSSTFKIDLGCGGFSPPPLLLFLPTSPGLSQPPPLFPPRNILVLQQTCWRTQVGAWPSRTTLHRPVKARVLPAASQARGGPCTCQAHARHAPDSAFVSLPQTRSWLTSSLPSGLRLEITFDVLRMNELTCEKHLEQCLAP